jgi:surface antigen
MDTGWIQVFVLTLAECVAPAGKTVCQQQEFELTFLTQADCQVALEQLVTLKDAAENIIVDKSKTRCEATARRQATFASVAAAAASAGDEVAWRAPDSSQQPLATVDANYENRLQQLKACDETDNVAPCKIGEIIIEDAVSGEPVEVWRQDKK